MKTVRESTTLYNFLGSHNPYWRLTESSDVLRFSTTETTEPDRTLQLSAEQAARIREMTVITSSLMMSLTVDESDLSVHLVGRKINKREWAGNASALKRRTKNAKTFHDKCENFTFRASNETAALTAVFLFIKWDHFGYG